MTYEEFADARLAALVRYAVLLTGDPYLAEDLVQETMVRTQLNWRRVRRADSPDRYVRRMLTNLYVDWRRGSWFKREGVRLDPRLSRSLFDAIRGDTVADWVRAHPGEVADLS